MITENIILTEEFTWTDIEEPVRADIPFIQEEFNIPSLFLVDFMRTDQLPKYEKDPAGHFFLLRFFDINSRAEDITVTRLTNKVAVFITDRNVFTIHSSNADSVMKYADLWRGQTPPRFPQILLHRLLHVLVLTYEEALNGLQERYEEFEREVLSKEEGVLSKHKVYEFRRRLFVIQGTLQVILQALNNSKDFWGEKLYLQQDIKENVDQAIFKLEGLSKNFDQLFQLYFLMNDTRNNEVMKVLTIFASLMLPLTFICSFYGMNFKDLPGVHTTSGLMALLLFMATITFAIGSFFYRKKWLRTSV